jgi:glycine cleavage system H protein
VLDVNQALADDPALVNSDPYGAGWMVKLKVLDDAQLDDLMDAAGYATLVGGE